jgi:hypothetical protein
MKDLKPFYKKLRELGFKRTLRSRSRWMGDYIQYEAKFPDFGSKVEVSFTGPAGFMKESCYLVSNFHKGFVEYGISDSFSSIFTSVKGMVKAIEFEKARHKNGVDKNVQKHFH